MDISELQAFLSVASQGSFSRAAEQLFLTQPAVSKRVASLEAELGTHLFDRIGHKPSLTEAGRTLLPRAERIVTSVNDCKRALADLSGDVSGELRIGTSHHIGLHRLPNILREFNQRYPGVELDLHFMDSEHACLAIERGELELAIVTLPLKASRHLLLDPVWDDPLCLMVAGDHPLLALKKPSLRDLSKHQAVLPGRGTFTREIIEQAMQVLEVDLHVRFSTNYLETIKMLTSIGLGWSILPQIMLDRELRTIHIPRLQLHRTLGLVRHRRRSLSNASQAMVDLLLPEKSTPG